MEGSKRHRQAAADDHRSRQVTCAVLTISDTRSLDDDASGDLIVGELEAAGHVVAARDLVKDDVAQIRSKLGGYLADGAIQAVLTTGGTGIARRDTTIDVVRDLLTVELEGFGDLFRMLSYEEVGASAMLSRAVGGLVCSDAGDTFIFAMPGSVNAVQTAMDGLITSELSHLVWERKR